MERWWLWRGFYSSKVAGRGWDFGKGVRFGDRVDFFFLDRGVGRFGWEGERLGGISGTVEEICWGFEMVVVWVGIWRRDLIFGDGSTGWGMGFRQ